MKNSFLLFLILLFSLCAGCAAAEMQSPATLQFDVTLHMEPELVEIPYEEDFYAGMFSEAVQEAIWEAQKQQDQALIALLNQIKIRCAMDTNGQLGVCVQLKEKDILTLDVRMTEEGGQIGSTLFPSFLMCATAEELAQEESLIQPEELVAAFQETVSLLMEDAQKSLHARIQSTETGAFAFEGYTFTEKTVIEMTAEDFFGLLLKGENRMIPLIEKMYGALGIAEDPEAMEQALADTQEQEMPEEWQGKTLRIVQYGLPEKNASYVEMCLAGENVLAALKGLGTRESMWWDVRYTQGAYQTAEEVFAAFDAGAEDITNLRLEIRLGDGMELMLNSNISGFAEWLKISVSGGEDALNGQLEYGRDPQEQPLLSLQLDGKTEPRALPPLNAEGKEALYFLQVMERAEAIEGTASLYETAEYRRFQNDMNKAMNSLLIQAILAAPEEVQAYMDAQTAFENALMDAIYMNFQEELLELEQENDVSF